MRSKKRKRPVVKDKRTLDLKLDRVQAVDIDEWNSPGIEAPKQIKKRKLTETMDTSQFSMGRKTDLFK